MEALKVLAKIPINVIIISNQSLVGRGELSIEEAYKIDKYIVDTIESNEGRIDESFYCFHDRDECCSCRKPQPGSILKAIDKYNIDPSISYFIGDWHTDLEAAKRANVIPVLVKTGKGQEYLDMVGRTINTIICDSLSVFVNNINVANQS